MGRTESDVCDLSTLFFFRPQKKMEQSPVFCQSSVIILSFVEIDLASSGSYWIYET